MGERERVREKKKEREKEGREEVGSLGTLPEECPTIATLPGQAPPALCPMSLQEVGRKGAGGAEGGERVCHHPLPGTPGFSAAALETLCPPPPPCPVPPRSQ